MNTSELTEEQQNSLQEAQRERYRQWRNQPETQQFFLELQASRLEAMEAWAHEKYTGSNQEEWALANATALGGLRVLNDLMDKKVFVETKQIAMEAFVE